VSQANDPAAFDELLRRLARVTKREIEKEEEKHRKKREHRAKSRKIVPSSHPQPKLNR
jgi:hypothetical protein